MLNAIDVKIEDLVLDPNNPRFVKDFKIEERVPEDKLVESEERILSYFSIDKPRSDEEVTNAFDLYESMLNIGFVPIDRVVVRKVEDTKKYLVIEGNRRVSTVKKLLALLQDDSTAVTKQKDKIRKHVESFQVIPCKLIETEGLTEEQISHNIAVLLGLRHHGSLLEWDPLPRAYNIYSEYMILDGVPRTEFKVDKKSIDDVSARLSIPSAKVRTALKTYVAYLQLCEANPSVKDKHYSLIEAAVTNRYLSQYYLNTDTLTYQLDDESIVKFDELCQFEKRDDSQYKGKKIVNKPQAIGRFASLLKRMNEQEHNESRLYISSQIERLLDEDSELTLEQANDNVTNYLNRIRWVEATETLLAKQEGKLEVSDYTGVGNDRAEREAISATLKKLRRIIEPEA